jgi:hypothetical protein
MILAAGALMVLVVLLVFGYALLLKPSRAKAKRQRHEAATRDAALIYRCRLQHARWMRGDVRGIYGQYPPADL